MSSSRREVRRVSSGVGESWPSEQPSQSFSYARGEAMVQLSTTFGHVPSLRHSDIQLQLRLIRQVVLQSKTC